MTAAAPSHVLAWAAVGSASGKVLRWKGRYAIYTHKWMAVEDCPPHGRVVRVRIAVVREK